MSSFTWKWPGFPLSLLPRPPLVPTLLSVPLFPIFSLSFLNF